MSTVVLASLYFAGTERHGTVGRHVSLTQGACYRDNDASFASHEAPFVMLHQRFGGGEGRGGGGEHGSEEIAAPYLDRVKRP